MPQVDGKFGILGVLVVAPCVGLAVGAINGAIIVTGRLQPFIVTLAMMVTTLGSPVCRRAGQRGRAVYSGTNARPTSTSAGRALGRAAGARAVLPRGARLFMARAELHRLRPLRLRHRRQRGGDAPLRHRRERVKIATYAFSGMLACIAGVLYVAQYRQGKPDAGVGLELDAIAAVVIGGTSLMGGRGSLAGTLVGVLIFGMLANICSSTTSRPTSSW